LARLQTSLAFKLPGHAGWFWMTVGDVRLHNVATALLIAIVALSPTNRANAADAAYLVDAADVAAPGECKVESWVSSAGNRGFIAAVNPACGINLFRDIEVSAALVRARTDGEWVTAVAPKVKTNLIPGAIGSWGVGLAATVAYDFTARQTAGLAIIVPATLRLTNLVSLNVNVGWLLDRTVDRHYFTYGAGVDWRTADDVWMLTGEVFGLAGDAEERSAVQPRFQAGIRYRPVQPFSIDLVYGRNITGENAHWITLATIYRFPEPGK
jgi:hypothetical protein